MGERNKDIEAPAKKEKGKKREKPTKKYRTLHTFLLKKLVDDPDVEGGLLLIGTFVQRVLDLDEETAKEYAEDEKNFFSYRFNENSASEDSVIVRRVEPEVVFDVDENGDPKVDENGKEVILCHGVRATMQARVPLEVDVFTAAFPFTVSLATAAIELSSIFLVEKNHTARPDFLLFEDDPRNTVAIQNKEDQYDEAEILLERLCDVSPTFGLREAIEENIEEKVLGKLDKTKSYEFLSPYPEVSFLYDHKKEYCPRFIISFYCVKPGFQKLVAILLPMFLVFFLAILNVLNDIHYAEGEDISSHLQVSSALTLAIVFVLPQLLDEKANRDKLWTKENLSIIVFFVGLVFASVPAAMSPTIFGLEQIIGVVLMGLATFLLPITNCAVYFRMKNIIGKRATTKRPLLMNKKATKWSGKHGLKGLFTVNQLLEDEKVQDGSHEFYFVGKSKKDSKHRLWVKQS